MEAIKFRFWNTDYTHNPMMEVGTTEDLKFVERSIGKDKMLFTGLLSKNGKDVYVGDIMDYGNNRMKEVIFVNGVFCLKGLETMAWLIPMCPLISNKYEYPELVGV